MRRSSLAATLLSSAVALAILTTAPVYAQSAASQRGGGAEPAVHKTAPDGKKVLTLADYGPWKRITSAAVSDNGGWMTYTFTPNDGDDTLFVKALDHDQLYRVPTGSAPAGRGGRGDGGGGGGAVQFSDNSQWIAYFVNPPKAKGRGRSARGAPAPASGGNAGPGARGDSAAKGDTNSMRHLELLNLATGAKYDVPNASGFQFAAGSQWLAIKMNGTPKDTSHHGTDLLLRRLATGATQNIGNVDQYDFDDAGNLIAYTVDAADRLGNGAYVIKLATGETRVLDSKPMEYAGLAWRDSSASLAVLRGEKPKDKEQRVNSLLAWTDAATSAPVQWADTSVAKGFVLSEYSAPKWSKDGTRLFLGIKEQEDVPPKSTEPQANLDIWHWKDTELQSQQMIQINQLRHATFAGDFTLATGRFVQLADSNMKTVTPTADGRWAVGSDPTPYEYDYSEGQPSRADYYRINTTTGERTLMAKHVLHTMGTSPDSRWFLYQVGEHVMAYDITNGKTVNVDAATGKSFINTDDDQAGEKPIWGVAGWSKDGRSVLLYDKYDIWALPLDGSKGRDLTAGAGSAEEVQLRLAHLSADARSGGGGGRFGGAPAQAVDLSQSQPLTAYGEWTKKSGYWEMPAGGGKAAPLLWADKMIGEVQKAKHADRVIFTEQTFREFPDYWTSNTKFATPTKVTDANPQIVDYAWGSRVLINYTNSKGRKLQGTLTLPADYQPGKKYPMLVYIYEILSNTHHLFSMPVYDDRPHMSEYASDGYLMFEPDIVYETGKPGSSALDCVTAAVNKVIALGYADPAHIGLQGHSWGGYESSFILTQTNMFAAVVTGAPLTDLISMYGELYKQSGTWNGGILQTSQGRMGANVTPWNATQLYESQSPVFNVTKITTPFMILQGTADGAVDWDQGLEFYNAARTNGKKVIWLSYPGEPHHLAKTPNQKDFQIRMKQFFDHYLKGAPAPDWMTNGLAQVHKGAPIH